MKLKLLNLNCWEFVFFDEIVEFVIIKRPDIIAFQEASTSSIVEEGEYVRKTYENQIEAFSKSINYKYVFAPSWGVRTDDNKDKIKGVVIFYKPELELVVFYSKTYSNYAEYPKMTHEREDGLLTAKTKKERYLYSWKKPLNYLVCLFKINNTYIRIITTQLCISYYCTETFQRVQQATELAELIVKSKDIPTILCGDFNIEADSHSMEIISNTGMNIETAKIKNSLEKKVHPLFDPSKSMKLSQSDGYCVDHILTKNIQNPKLYTYQGKSISDHIAMILTFEL